MSLKVQPPTSDEVAALNEDYRIYIRGIRATWLAEHRPRSDKLYQLMDADELKEVDGVINAWGAHVTPLAEAWWKERGFGVVWPPTNSETMQVFKLED